jgi:hypothetical protein
VKIDRAPASTWITEQLARPVANDVLTVVWQSITEQYWPDSEREAVAAALDDAASDAVGARVDGRSTTVPRVGWLQHHRTRAQNPRRRDPHRAITPPSFALGPCLIRKCR